MPGIDLSLQPAGETGNDNISIGQLIESINAQRGSFRTLTEAGILKEQASKDETVENIGKRSDTAIGESCDYDEIFQQGRQDLLREVGLAQHQSAVALDLVSLLLSQQNPTTASLTLSQYIKASVPFGSIGLETLKQESLSESQRAQTQLISLGLRIRSLGNAADSLLDAATRLEQIVQQETRYWAQVLTIKERQWPIARLPQDKHTLGIRFKSLESRVILDDHGSASIFQDNAGDIHISTLKPHTSRLHLQLYRDQAMTAELYAFERPTLAGINKVEDKLLDARNGIFDEELLYEIHREAQSLANQEVQILDNSISLPLANRVCVKISLARQVSTAITGTREDTKLLEFVALSLRLCLSEAHRENLRSRSQRPEPMRNQGKERPTYCILQHVLDFSAFKSGMASIKTLLISLQSMLLKAGIGCQISISRSDTKFPDKAVTATRIMNLLSATQINLKIQSCETLAISLARQDTSIDSGLAGWIYKIEQGGEEGMMQKNLAQFELIVCARVIALLQNYVREHVSGWQLAHVTTEGLVRSLDHDGLCSKVLSIQLSRQQLKIKVKISGRRSGSVPEVTKQGIWKYPETISEMSTDGLLELLGE